MQKRVEVTKLELASVFRVTVIVGLVPGLFSFVAGLFYGEFILWNLIVTPLMSGVGSVVAGFIYNLVAKNFGGIQAEINVDDL